MDKNNKQKTVDIILPSRLGDCIISIPALTCLKTLNEKHNNKYKIRLVSANGLTNIIDSLDIFEIIQMNFFTKVLSWLKPSDKMISLFTSSKILGYKAKITYGCDIPRKLLRFNNQMPYLHITKTKDIMNSKLFNFLSKEKNIPNTGISFFGICLELGFTPEEIIENFDFNLNSIEFKKELINWKSGLEAKNYFAFCMEAAYGSKKDTDRRWNEENYINIAKRLYDEYNIESAFIGINDSIKLPDTKYIHDFRKKLSLEKICILFKHSKGYIGNDTGPLHIANLLQKPTVGIYFREASLKDYFPLFKNLNHPIFNPENIEEVFNQVKLVINNQNKTA